MSVITIDEIRSFLNDYPQTNRWLRDVEFTPERITNAIKYVVDDWNETPPKTPSYTPDTFPYKTTLLYGVVSFLLSSEAISQERNHIAYQSGGVAVDENHSSAYTQLSSQFLSKYKDLVERQKKVENWESAWRTIPSWYYNWG